MLRNFSRVPILGICFLATAFFTSLPAQNSRIDSLLEEELVVTIDSNRIDLYNEISWEYFSSNRKKFLEYAERALELAEKTQYLKGLIRAKNLIAIEYSETGKVEESIKINLEALKLSEQIAYLQGIISCNNDLGISYGEIGDYEKSLFHYQKSLEKETSPEGRYRSYSNLSYLYYDMGNEVEANKYLKLAVDAAKETKDPETMATMYIDLGYLEENKKNYEQAITYFNKAGTYAGKIQDLRTQGQAEGAIANIYFTKEEYDKSLKALKKVNKFNELMGFTSIYDEIFLSDVYIKLKRYDEGLELGEKALEKAKDQKMRPILPNLYKILAEGYLGLKDYEKAIDMQSVQMLIQDSLNSETNAETLAKLEAKFKLKEKEAENQLLKEESELTGKELALTKKNVRQQKIITAGTILGLLAAFGLLFYVFRLLKTVRKTNQQLKEQSVQLRAAKIKAESAAKAKSEFLSVMSHEIRTPMNAVIGMTHLLVDEDPREEQLEHLNVLQFSGNNLIALINDILDFSKIEAGKMELEKVDFNLKNLVKSITASMQIKGSDKGIEVKYDYDPKLKDMYQGDSVRLGQVLINLMGNAVKFTEKGSVELQVAVGANGNMVFRVKDTGIGIPAEKQASIFSAFSQSSEDTTRKFGGTGLGLTISRKLVEIMGSKLQLESQEGEGSIFYFETELPEGKQKTMAKDLNVHKPKSNLKFGSLEGARILVAEDNKTNQLVARKFLEKWEAVVDVVEDGKQAVEAWGAGDYDLILMDVQMPVMEGTEACKKIRELESGLGERTPILAFTASVVQDELMRLKGFGMDDWVSKPFDPAVLFQKIDKYRRVKSITA